MLKINLVTGANGHLGNNLVRFLLEKGETVRASVRDINNKKPFEGLDCELVYADLLDKNSLEKALDGVDTLYQVASVFKHWSLDPQKDIYEANMLATKNVLEVAARKKVKRIIYVSSIAALDMKNQSIPIDENAWSKDRYNAYFDSKTDSEKLAWQLAKELKLNMVAVLPSAMVGSVFYNITPTIGALKNVLDKKAVFDGKIHLNYVDVKDVAEGCYLAALKGRAGERYILGTENPLSQNRLVELANEIYPELKIKKPTQLPKWLLLTFASLAEFIGTVLQKQPFILRSQIHIYFNNKRFLNIAKARNELGFNPRLPEVAVQETFKYFIENKFSHI